MFSLIVWCCNDLLTSVQCTKLESVSSNCKVVRTVQSSASLLCPAGGESDSLLSIVWGSPIKRQTVNQSNHDNSALSVLSLCQNCFSPSLFCICAISGSGTFLCSKIPKLVVEGKLVAYPWNKSPVKPHPLCSVRLRSGERGGHLSAITSLSVQETSWGDLRYGHALPS